MVRPLWCFISMFAAFFICFAFFLRAENGVAEFYYLTTLLLIGFYTAYGILTDRQSYMPRTWAQVIPKAAGKYAFWGFQLWLASTIYRVHGLYSAAFPHAGDLFKAFFQIFLYIGLPYHLASEKWRYSYSNFLGDSYLRCLSQLRLLLRGRFRLARDRVFRGEFRRFLLSSLLRFHFVAIMTGGLHNSQAELLSGIKDFWARPALDAAVVALTAFAWSIDNNNGALGYLWESNFTRIRFKKVDTTAIHWIVTLSCYAPFNLFVGNFLISPALSESGTLFLADPWFKITSDLVLLFFLFGYVLSGTTLSFSCSNLSYKCIQTRGPYSVVRHPCTFFKLGLFGTMIFRFSESWTWYGLVGYLTWCGIYFARTICEERFLRKQSEYLEYMDRVKYRLIPGIL